MREPGNILRIARLNPAYMGFIFYPPSSRYVGPDFLLPDGLPTHIRKVAVFVDEKTDVMLGLMEKHQMDYLQLHGRETVAQCRALQLAGAKIIKAFSIDEQFDFNTLAMYAPYVAYFLFDGRGAMPGGNGITFSWKLLEQYRLPLPFFISGGIGAEQLAGLQELQKQPLHAIDLNSAIEIKAGLKSPAALEILIDTLHKIYHSQ